MKEHKMSVSVNITFVGLVLEDETISLHSPDVNELKRKLFELHKIPPNFYYCVSKGKPVEAHFENGEDISVVPRLCGGKGGFGSMLRAIGAQIEKTTNREACRDLSGRRLRDINEEQRLKKWISLQAEREREAEERKKRKLEKLAREPKHEFKDEKYDQERSELSEKLYDSIEQGLKASSSGIKRKNEEAVKPKKKKKTLLDLDEELSSEDDSDEKSISDDETNKKTNFPNKLKDSKELLSGTTSA